MFKCNAWFSSLTVTYMTKEKNFLFSDFQLASIGGNELALITFDPMVSKWQRDDNNLLVFDNVNIPSIFTLRKTCQGIIRLTFCLSVSVFFCSKLIIIYIYILGKESRQYIYVSNHPNNTRQVEKICDILKKEHGLECLRSNYQGISSGIGNDVVLRLTKDFRKASHYLVYLSWDYMNDVFCQFGEAISFTK